MCLTDPNEEYLSNPDLNTYQAIAIGMGIGQHKKQKNNPKMSENNPNQHFVIDADALNILQNRKKPFSIFPKIPS